MSDFNIVVAYEVLPEVGVAYGVPDNRSQGCSPCSMLGLSSDPNSGPDWHLEHQPGRARGDSISAPTVFTIYNNRIANVYLLSSNLR